MVATAVTLNDLEGHSPVADVFTCNPSNICAASYTISTDSVFTRFFYISRAYCVDWTRLFCLSVTVNTATALMALPQ